MYFFNEFLWRSSATNQLPSKEPLQFLPNWTSDTLAQLVLTVVFNPWDLYYQENKRHSGNNNNNITDNF